MTAWAAVASEGSSGGRSASKVTHNILQDLVLQGLLAEGQPQFLVIEGRGREREREGASTMEFSGFVT